MKPSILIQQQKDIILSNLRMLRYLGGINQEGFVYLSNKLFDVMCMDTEDSSVEHPVTGRTTSQQASKMLFTGIKIQNTGVKQ